MTELSESQQAVVTLLASMRQTMNATNGVANRKRSTANPYAVHLEGLGGEIAFAMKFNLFPDLTFAPREGGSDFKTRSGSTVDVKTTRHENGHLLVSPDKARNPSDLYVLMVGEFPAFRYVGYAPKERVFQPDKLVDLGYGLTYALEQKELLK